MHRFWLKRANYTLKEAKIDVECGLGGSKAGVNLLGRSIKASQAEVTPEKRHLRAHGTYTWRVEGLIEARGYDISVAKHADAVRACLREEGPQDLTMQQGEGPWVRQWAAHYHAAIPRAHLGALSSFRFGTTKFARNVAHDLPIGSRLCQFCVRRGKAFIEDEAHVMLDCPLYEDMRMDMVVALRGTRAPYRPNYTDSQAAKVLGAMFNPGCFASARAVARFSHRAIDRHISSATSGDPMAVCGLARVGLEEWLGMEIPPPVPVSWHSSALLLASDPAVLKDIGGALGFSKFDPFKLDEGEREWQPSSKKAARPPPVDPSMAPHNYARMPILGVPYVGGMGDQGPPAGDLLGASCFDPGMYD